MMTSLVIRIAAAIVIIIVVAIIATVGRPTVPTAVLA